MLYFSIVFFYLYSSSLLIDTLSRKAEGIDPMKPWQPLIFIRKVLNSTSCIEIISIYI
jgi:hypothetical protein